MKNRLLAVVAAGEALTGLVLLVYPPIVVRLLFGAELIGVSIPVARVLGIALIGIGYFACWPCGSASRALCGMLTYSALTMAYLLYLGIRGEWVGPLLWPAVVLHAVLTLLLARAWFKPDENGSA